MSEASEGRTATNEPLGFSHTFAQVVLVILLVLVFVCDALPAIGARLPAQGEIGTGPMASLYHFLFDFFWPGTILVHAGLATLWLACGTWRYSLRLLSVILSMSARAAWVWWLYGIKQAHINQLGEPFNVCGIPIFFAAVTVTTSIVYRSERFHFVGNSSPKRPTKFQTIDLIAWTTATALLLAPTLTFFRALTPSVLMDRFIFDTPVAAAWACMTWLSAMLVREWLLDARFTKRLSRLGWAFVGFIVLSGVLIVGARLVSEIGPEDMLFNILSYLVPSMFAWCMATGWALRELGIRLGPHSPALPRNLA
jgi:hypothetical protein